MRSRLFAQKKHQSIVEPAAVQVPPLQSQTEMMFVENIREQRKKSIQIAIKLYNELRQANVYPFDLSTFRQYIESYNGNCRSFRQGALETPSYNLIYLPAALSSRCLPFISAQQREVFQKIQEGIADEENTARMQFLSQHSRVVHQNNPFIKIFNLILFVTLIGMLVPSNLRRSAAYGFAVNLLWGVPYTYYTDVQVARLRLDEIYPTKDYFSSEELSVQFNETEVLRNRI